MRFTIVLFPAPVLPIIAVTVPGLNVKLISSIALFSAPGNLKLTCSNSRTPFAVPASPFNGKLLGSFGFSIEDFDLITSSILSAATLALGRMMDITVSITNDMTI